MGHASVNSHESLDRTNGIRRVRDMRQASSLRGSRLVDAAESTNGSSLPFPQQPSSAGSYKCLVVDPPWDQGKTGLRVVRPNQGTELPYPTMTYQEIADIPVGDWAASESFLWLWATNSRSRSSDKPILIQAFDLMEHWGFRYYTTLSWDKKTGPCPFGPYQITTEHCLFGYRGKCSFPKESLGQMKTMFTASVSRHSEKPSILYEQIHRYFNPPKLDVFARRKHSGFEAWGNEVERR